MKVVTFFIGPISNTYPKSVLSLQEFYQLIKSDVYEEPISRYRAETDKEAKKRLKDNLDFVMVGEFSTRDRNVPLDQKLNEPTEILQLDLDNYTGNYKEIKEVIKKDPHVLLAFSSPSGKAKVFVRIPQESNKDGYKQRWNGAITHFSKKWGLKPECFDDKAKDITRACFVSYDSTAFLNEKAECFTGKSDVNPMPEKQRKNDFTKTMKGVSEGSRNDRLFKLSCSLKHQGNGYDTVLSTIQAVNQKNDPPLPDGEVKSIVNSAFSYSSQELLENIKTPEELKTKVCQLIASKQKHKATELMAMSILRIENIYTTRSDEKPEIWIYKEGIYIPEARTYIREHCRIQLGEAFTDSLAKEVIAKIETETYINPSDFFILEDPYLLPVANGLLNLKTKELTSFNPKYRFFTKIPVKFVPEKDCKIIREFFSTVLSNNEDIRVIQEIFGYCLYRDYKYEKCFMFTGGGRNGKGKTIELLKRFLGADNCSNIPLEEIANDRFAASELFGVLANLAADIGSMPIKDSKYLKMLTGHDMISASRKYKNRLKFVNYAKLIFSANDLPISYDNTLAFFNRWILIDFKFTFYPKQEFGTLNEEKKKTAKLRDPNIIKKISTDEELTGLLNWALEGFDRLFKNNDFTTSPSTLEVQERWVRKSNSVQAFLMDCIVEDYDQNITRSEFRKVYALYCKKFKLSNKGDKLIKYTLETTLGVSSKQISVGSGSREWVWVGIGFNIEKLTEFEINPFQKEGK